MSKAKKEKKMKNLGVLRPIDNLGRICIPKEMRRFYNLGSEVEVCFTTDGILIRNPKYIVIDKKEYQEIIKNNFK
jgi:bifunctional DNA-binding transcriptional regulator/antitoxin component of YhaV-PrlF toxin-antitoxin module